jgi:hypothetical protein
LRFRCGVLGENSAHFHDEPGSTSTSRSQIAALYSAHDKG